MSQRALRPAIDLGDHLALRHRAMGQHRLAGDVADGVDAAHGRAAAARRCGRTARPWSRSSSSRPQPSVAGRRPTVTRIRSAGSVRDGCRRRSRPQRTSPFAASPLAGDAGSTVDAELAQARRRPAASARRRSAAGCAARPRRRSPPRRAWRTRCRARGRCSRRRRRRGGAGTSLERQRLGRRDHRPAERQDRQLDRRASRWRSRGARRGSTCGPARSRPRRSCRRGTAPSPRMTLTPACFEQRGDAAGQPADDAVLPGDGRARSRASGAAAEMPSGLSPAAVARRCCERVGGVDQRLRRDAADVEAGAAELCPPRRARCRCRAGRRGSRRRSRRARRRGRAALQVIVVHRSQLSMKISRRRSRAAP